MSISLHPRKGADDLVINGRWWRYLREVLEALGSDVFADSGDEYGGPTPYLTASTARYYAAQIEDHLGELVELRHRRGGGDQIVRYEPALDSPELRRRHHRSKLVDVVRIEDDPEAVAFLRQFSALLRESSGVWIYDERVG